ncbi:exodeoxyribonuclease VII small subunit [Halomarina pelagica]|uniref:exodeoxyribonuclease VII small subunit n=1 Tax=Halomarina pelagica TaxID=2961599 RepID=UPI0020C23FFA|nr:exodeoxyribonuclease VII small subunit [Halomarina sp. BND7]
MAKDTDIADAIDHVNEIIDHLESDDLSLDEGETLLADGHERIAALRDRLDGEQGEIIELDE